MDLDDFEKSLVDNLKTGFTYEDVCEDLDVSQGTVRKYLDVLREKGVEISERRLKQGRKYFSIDEDVENTYSVNSGNDYRIGVVSDTHLGSEGEQLEYLNDFYNRLVKNDVDFVLHAGDVSDGCEIYRGHENHKIPEAIGWRRLEDYLVSNYPEVDEFKTLMISGNHDTRLFKKTGIRFVERVAERRKDLEYLGQEFASLDLNDEFSIDLVHPGGGSPYTLGYRAQTWLRNKKDSEKADMTVFGHLHQLLAGETEGSFILYAGSWQGQTPYLDRKGIKTDAGGWIVELNLEDKLSRIKTELFQYELGSEKKQVEELLVDG